MQKAAVVSISGFQSGLYRDAEGEGERERKRERGNVENKEKQALGPLP